MPSSMLASRQKRIDYIQYLRALAVSLVLVFHVDPAWLPSGYLGVDVFFAISGYVITRLIERQHAEGTFTLSRFFAQRAIRLLPPLFVTLMLTACAFAYIYTPTDILELARSSLAASFSVANVFFWLDAGYFSDQAKYKPLLHTWSLGVEEQFYLIWPFIALCLLRSRRTIIGCIVLSVAMLAFTVVVSNRHSDMVFYLSPFRAYEFLFGAFFAVALGRFRPSNRLLAGSSALLALSPVVLIGLCLPSYQVGVTQVFAQCAVVLLTAMSCYLAEIHQSSGKISIYDAPMIRPLLRQIGDKSYAIYLLHWPLILFLYHFSSLSQSSLLKLALLAGSILLGIALSVLLAMVFDSGRYALATQKTKLYAVLFLLLCSVGLSSFQIHHYSGDVSGQASLGVVKAQALKAEINALSDSFTCELVYSNSNQFDQQLAECSQQPSPMVLVLGDSLSFAQRAVINLLQPETRIVRVFINGCPPYFGESQARINSLNSKLAACQNRQPFIWNEALSKVTEDIWFDALVVSGNWYTQHLDDAAYRSSYARLNQLAIPVALAGIHATFKDSVPRLIERSVGRGATTDDFRSNLVNVKSMRWGDQYALNARLKQLAQDYENVTYIDLFSAICRVQCKVVDEQSNSLLTDQQHLSLYGAEWMTTRSGYQQWLRNNVE